MVIQDFLKTHILQVVLMVVLGVGVLFGAAWMMQKNVAQKEVKEITYEVRNAYDADETDNTLQYVVVTGGASDAILKKVNDVIYAEVVQGSCFGDPYAQDAREILTYTYASAFEDSEQESKSRLVEGMTDKEIRQRIVEDLGYVNTTSVDVVYAKNNALSLQVSYDVFCGGAHGNAGAFDITFDMRTGELIAFKDLFQNFERDAEKIRDNIFSVIIEKSDSDVVEECAYEEFPPESFSVVLQEDGLRLLYVGYPHAMKPCEPVGIVVPYEVLKEYFARDGVIARIYKL